MNGLCGVGLEWRGRSDHTKICEVFHDNHSRYVDRLHHLTTTRSIVREIYTSLFPEYHTYRQIDRERERERATGEKH